MTKVYFQSIRTNKDKKKFWNNRKPPNLEGGVSHQTFECISDAHGVSLASLEITLWCKGESGSKLFLTVRDVIMDNS